MTADPEQDALDDKRAAVELYDERARTAAWLGQQTFPPLEWIVEGILPEGMGLLVAPPKAGKSWLVLNIALAAAAGGRAIGTIPVAARPVLYLALEDGHRRLQSRLHQIHGTDDLPDSLELVVQADQTEALVLVDEFLSRHRDDAPLVVVDTFGRIKPSRRSNEDAYQADYRIGAALKRRADDTPGGCLLLVHHTRKAESTDFIDAVSGTQGIAGAADYTLVLSRKRTETEAVLAVTGRDVLENEYALTMNGGAWTIDGQDLMDSAAIVDQRRESNNKSDRTVKALAFVNGRPETRPADLAKHLDINADDAGRYLRRLHEDDLVRKAGRGLYKPVSVLSVVSERDEPAGDRPTDSGHVSDTLRTVSETDSRVSEVESSTDQHQLPITDTPDTSDTDTCSVHGTHLTPNGKCWQCSLNTATA